MSWNLPRLRLVAGRTPLVRNDRLCDRLGVDLWIKRDDATGGAEAGNKVRKLEFLLAEAQAQSADTVITCGGLQSNHARATALLAASIGLKSILMLRTHDINGGLPYSGNVLLDRLCGATIRLISPAEYQEREEVMRQEARKVVQQGGRPYVIPEGGSNGLGAMGYVEAMGEVRKQIDEGMAGGRNFDLIVHACGSGGTAAGIAIGAAAFDIAPEVRPMTVCNSASYFQEVIASIVQEARNRVPSLPPPVLVHADDRAKGPAYAVASQEQRAFIVEVARLAGLVLDPVYTGKALFGLQEYVRQRGAGDGKRVLFIHTGGLPGLLAQGQEFEGLC